MANESESVTNTTSHPPSKEDELMVAAQKGDIDRLIGEDAEVLRRIDTMEFVDTPLHMASSEGHIDFAMEMIYLKPSLAAKLNKDGLSALHIALLKGHTALAFLSPGFFSFVLMLSLSTLLFCLLDSALIIISPNDDSSKILFCFVYTMVYIIYSAILLVLIQRNGD